MLLKKYNSILNAFILFGLLFGTATQSLAFGDKLQYECPYINDKNKQTVGQLYQGYDGWFFKEDDFKQDFSLAPNTLAYFKRFSEALTHKGVTLVYTPLLTRSAMAYSKINKDDIEKLDYNIDQVFASYQLLNQQISDIGIVIPDMLTPIKATKQPDIEQLIYKTDHHWRPEGARQTAQAIAQILKSHSQYNDLSKIDVTSKIVEKINRTSPIQQALQQLCTDTIPAEETNIYKFDRVTQDNADALFGDTAGTPPIALMGTSFSAIDDFYFRDFIEEATGLETVNHSISGGQTYISIISYLSSALFREQTPTYLIWETPAKYELNANAGTYFRQMIPAVSGECTGDNVVAQSSFNLRNDSKKIRIFSELNNKNIAGNSYYLYIYANSPMFNRFTLEMEYDDGDGEWFNMDHSGRYRNNGQFFIELSDDIDSNLSEIILDNSDNVETPLTVKLCKK